jgi:uncharacterized membrane protein
MKKGLVLCILVGVLALGAFLRLNHLNDESLWLDEGITYYNSTGESYEAVWDKVAELDQSPPLYYFIMHTYLEVIGENEFGFRLIPLIFGILTILFLYLLIGAMFDEEAGLFAAFLLAVNPFHIGFSIESRMYGLMALEALMGFYFLYKAMYSGGRGYDWWLFFIGICIAGVYTHNFFFFVLLGFVFVYLLFLVGSEKKLGKFLMGIFSALVVVIAYIPWIINLTKQLSVERYWMAPNSWWDVKDYFLDFSNGSMYLLVGFLLLSVLGGAWTFFRRKVIDYKEAIIAAWALVIFVIIGMCAPLVYSLIFEPIMKIRYMIYLVPFFMGLAGLGIYAVRRFSMIFSCFILIGVVYVFIPWQASAYPVEIGEDFRGLVEIVNEKNASVVVHTPSIAHVINFYNVRGVEIIPFPNTDDLTLYNIDESDKSEFHKAIRGLPEFVLVVTHTHEDPHGLLYLWSDASCDESYEIGVEGMEVYYFSGCV